MYLLTRQIKLFHLFILGDIFIFNLHVYDYFGSKTILMVNIFHYSISVDCTIVVLSAFLSCVLLYLLD